MKNAIVAVVAILASLVVIAAVVLFGWSAGWWFTAQNVQREYDVNRTSQAYQAGIISQERDYATAWNAATDPTAKKHYADVFCSQFANITAIPNDIQNDYQEICH